MKTIIVGWRCVLGTAAQVVTPRVSSRSNIMRNILQELKFCFESFLHTEALKKSFVLFPDYMTQFIV